MPKFVDLTGHRFGRFTVLHRVPNKGEEVRWACACDCGNTKEVIGAHLKSGNTKSCGCWASDRAKKGINRKHNRSRTPLYGLWCSMRERCGNANNPNFPAYGGRGIYVCDRWQSFENFLADMGERPSPTHSLDRINNNGPYSPENCRWVGSVREQRKNCRDNRVLELNGERMILADWARRVSIDAETIAERIKMGWSVEMAITTPLRRNLLTYQGKTMGLAEWSALTGISRRTLSDRMKKGWPAGRVLSKP